MPALISLALSGIVLVLAIVALLMSKTKATPLDFTGTSAHAQRLGEVLRTLNFGDSKALIAKERTSTEIETALQSFDRALTRWLDATPKAYQPLVSGDIKQVRKLLGKFTPHFVGSDPGQARLEAGSIMQDASRSCIITSDRDLDEDRVNEPLQTALESMIELAGLTIIDPAPGTMWPPHASGTKSRGKKVARTDTRGLAKEERVLLEPEIQEVF